MEKDNSIIKDLPVQIKHYPHELKKWLSDLPGIHKVTFKHDIDHRGIRSHIVGYTVWFNDDANYVEFCLKYPIHN